MELRRQSRFGVAAGKRGSALLAAIIAVVVWGTISAGYLRLAHHEKRMAFRVFDSNALTYLAEAGIEAGVWALNSGDWSAWSDLSAATGKYLPTKTVTLGNGRSAEVDVITFTSGSAVQIYSRALVDVGGAQQEKQMRVEYIPSANKPGGLISKGKMDLSGGNMYFDAYSSDYGPPDSFFNRTDNVTVGTVSTSSDALKYNSGVYIYGYVGTGRRAPEKSGTVHVKGPSSTRNYDTSRISQDFNFEFPAVVQPSWSGAIGSLPGSSGTVTIGSSGASSPTKYNTDKIDMSDGDKLVVNGPVQMYLSDGLSFSGSSRIEIANGAFWEIYTPKDFTFSGNVVINDANQKKPENFKLFGTASGANDQTFSASGQAKINVVFDAPNAKVNWSGQVEIAGSAVSNETTVSGQVIFHYDEDLGGGGSDSDGISSWYELIDSSHKLDFDSYLPSQGLDV